MIALTSKVGLDFGVVYEDHNVGMAADAGSARRTQHAIRAHHFERVRIAHDQVIAVVVEEVDVASQTYDASLQGCRWSAWRTAATPGCQPADKSD